MDFRSILRNITKGDVQGHDFHGNQYTDGQAGFHLEGKDYEGKTGRTDHITRSEQGTIPTDAIKFMLGASGEKPFDHRHRQGEDWEAFKADIAKNGIKEPIFITVDRDGTPVINEGNHRRDAAVELGMKEVPVEVRYFGNAQEQGTIAQRPFPTSDLSEQNPLHNGKPVRKGDVAGHEFHGNQYTTVGGVSRKVYWHGSADGKVGTVLPLRGIHIGTYRAAQQALDATVGKPADGKDWNGERTLGETPVTAWYKDSGEAHTVEGWKAIAEQDPSNREAQGLGNPTFGDGTPIPLSFRPNIVPVAITGKMSNFPENPMGDWQANGRMASLLERGKARSGYYYANIAEDEGSVSAVVPSADHLTIIPKEQVVAKGDLLGHEFHGNQWLTVGGGFNPNPNGARRKPAEAKPAKAPRVRQPKPQPAPKAPTSAKPDDKSQQNGKNFKGLGTDKIASKGSELFLGGNQQKFMGKVTMENGEPAVVKQIGDWRGFSGEGMARAEVLASKVGEACDFPIRGVAPVEGADDTVVQAWVEGKTFKELGGEDYPTQAISSAPVELRSQLEEIKFFDVLTGNPDRHYANIMIDGIPDTVTSVDEAGKVAGASIVGIDHSLAFVNTQNFPPFVGDLRNASARLEQGRVTAIGEGLDNLLKSGTLTGWEEHYVETMAKQLSNAFPQP